MKFKIGDHVFWKFVDLTPAKIIGIYPSTARYKISYDDGLGDHSSECFVRDREIFESKKEYAEIKIKKINDNIVMLKEEIEKLEVYLE